MLARIESAAGNPAAACRRLIGMLEEVADREHRAAIHYWLFRLQTDYPHASTGDQEIDPERHRAEALRLLNVPEGRSRTILFRRMIDDLR